MTEQKESARPWLVAAAAVLGASAGLFRIRTFDTFIHLAAGRLILETGTLPSRDPFSFSFRGAVWHNHAPLFQVLIAAVHGAAGFVGLSLFQALCAGLLTWMGIHAAVRAGASVRVACALGILPVFLFREAVNTRPLLLSYLFLLVSLSAMLDAESDGRLRRLAWVPLVYLAWLYSHGSHPLLLVVMAVWLVGAAVRRRRRLAVAMGGALATCVVMALLLRPGSFALAGTHLASGFLAQMIPEWRPLGLDQLFGSWTGLGFLLLWVLALGGLAANCGLFKIAQVDTVARPLHQSLLLLGFMILAFTSHRMAPLFMLGAAPLWLREAAFPVERMLAAFRGRVSRRWPVVDKPATASGAVLATCAVVAALGLAWPSPLQPGVGLARERFPSAAVATMRERGLGKRVYNAYNWGGFLMFERYPAAGVFVDGRAITVYPPRFLGRFVRAYAFPPLFERLARDHRVDSVLMPVRSPLTGRLRSYLEFSPRWREAYCDSLAVLFVRDDTVGGGKN